MSEPCELLSFLTSNLQQMSRNNVKTLLKSGSVDVDGASTTQHNYQLLPGQSVNISPRGQGGGLDNIIYEDDEIIVINKPAKLLSIASDYEKGHTAYRMVTDYVRQSSPRNRVFIIHRLDRDTSGVLMFAKNEKIKRAFQDKWNDLVFTRGYKTIVEGKLREPEGKIRSFLLETQTHLMYSSDTEGDGLEAITSYKVERESAEFSMLDINLLTGRKNQIRVHMKDIGHPVIGDKKYGSSSNPIGRMGLHAYLLELTHPLTNKKMRLEAPVPREFTGLFSPKRGRRSAAKK